MESERNREPEREFPGEQGAAFPSLVSAEKRAFGAHAHQERKSPRGVVSFLRVVMLFTGSHLRR